MGKIIAVCTSKEKGTAKENIHTALAIRDFGLENDAHGGNWHRQISLLSYDAVMDFDSQIPPGAFGENLLIAGLPLLAVGTFLQCGEAVLKITQIGKECHTKCQIYHKMGDCIMPRLGLFAKVIQEGEISAGDNAAIVHSVAVVTISDKGAKGEREDISGRIIAEKLAENGYAVVHKSIHPDEKPEIENTLKNLSDSGDVQLILTTGGTGLSLRDVTPEATLAVADRHAPGIAETIRAHSATITPMAMLSRGVAITRGQTLIINLPGSPKAVGECLDFLLPTLPHAIQILCGLTAECAT